MIWFALALFVVSFLITTFLAPKPDIEDARASTLDNVQFPRATEDAPYPLVLGKVLMKGPNTLWYGDFDTIPIKEKIKTGLFSSTTVIVGYRYFLGLDMGLCMGPGVAIHDIIIDEESVWSGNVSASGTAININAPNHFGGYKEGGGFIGTLRFYAGGFSETVNPYLEGVIGSGNVPAYNGLARLVFEQPEIGESAQLRKTAFVVSSYTNDLGITGGSGTVNTDDINPMEAIYQIMTDDWRGLGISADDIDATSFLAAAETLFTEGNGVSVQVTTAAQGKKVISEILRQIDGILYQAPTTGKFTIKLIRDDYVVEDLDVYNEDDIVTVRNFTKTSWEDVVAQVKVSFPQRDRESNAVAVSQDMATAGMIGRLKTVTQSFPFCYDKTLANKLASRERAQQSVPLFRMTLEMNRNGYTLVPGSVFKMSWADYGITEIVMRVKQHDLGELLNNKVVVDCIQDSFALDTLVFADPADSTWVRPVTNPTDILVSTIVEMPYFFGSRLNAPVIDGRANVIPFPVRPSASSSGFDMVEGIATGDANLDIRDRTAIPYPATGTLTAAYDLTAGIATGYDATGFTLENVLGSFPASTPLADIQAGEGGLLYVDGEWMGYTGSVTTSTVNITGVYRGLFGSQVKTHALGTRVFALSLEQLGTGILSLDLTETSTVYYKLLDRVGSLAQDITEVSESSQATNAGGYHDRPLRPRFLEIDSNRTGIVINDITDATLTWRASNRASSVVPIENDAAETPDESEVYDVEVYVGGVLNGTFSSDDETSPYTLPFSSTAINETNCEVRVFAKRSGGNLRESAAYAILPFELNQVFAIGDTRYWDTYGSLDATNLKGVYSLRLRRSAYAGAAVRIRDTNDDSEQDVGFDADGNLASFSVVGEARVTTWYDQSGNSFDLTQTTNANQPRLTTGTTAGRRPRIEFGTVAGGGSHWLSSPTFSDASPNDLLIARPTWWGDADWVGNNYSQYAFSIPISATASYNPYYRFGILHESDEGFEHRYNGIIYTEPSPYNSAQTGVVPWLLDAASGSTIDSWYDRMDAVALQAPYASNITVGGATSCVRIGADGSGIGVWNGSTSDFVVSNAGTSSGVRQAISRELYFWHNNVVFLCDFEGADASTSATDDSITGHSITFNGSAQIDTAQFKFGTSSLLLSGGISDYITIADNDEFTIGANEFTVEAWVRFANASGNQAIISHWNDSGSQKGWVLWKYGNQLSFSTSSNGSSYTRTDGPFTWAADTWYHVVATRDSANVIRLFVDGALVGSKSDATNIFNCSADLTLGRLHDATFPLNGWIDEPRIINNRCVWNSAFQVPDAPHHR